MFYLKYRYPSDMNQKLFFLPFSLLLTGCIGSFVSGQTEYLNEAYPDIRKVPERKEALAPRGQHQGEETAARAVDFKQLQQDWEKINARDKALRESMLTPGGKDDL